MEAPPVRAHERARAREPNPLVSPLIPRLVMILNITDFVMIGRGRRAGTSREVTHVVTASARRWIARPRKRAMTLARFRGLCVSPRARRNHRATTSRAPSNIFPAEPPKWPRRGRSGSSAVCKNPSPNSRVHSSSTFSTSSTSTTRTDEVTAPVRLSPPRKQRRLDFRYPPRRLDPRSRV